MTVPGKEAYGEIPEGRMHSGNREFLGDMGYRSIIDFLPCYVSVQDVNLCILFTNKSFEKDFGTGVGRICHEVYKGTIERCPSCPVQRSFEDKRVHFSEETTQLSNGERADLAVYSAPILDIFGEVKAVIELSGNITKLKESQRELAVLGQSVAILSHDIKNILEGLQGGAYVVDQGIKDGDMALARKGWDIVKRNIGDITSVTRNILYSSKKRFLKRQNIHLGSLIDDVAALFSERAKTSATVLETKVNPSLLIARLDPSSIRRMLNNLLSNALEACRADKKKHFHKIMVRADFYDKKHVMIEVEDNGIGMTNATRKKIFEGFYSTKGDSGTGLGMLVVNSVVEAHGGRIELLTARGKGTTFRIILPLR